MFECFVGQEAIETILQGAMRREADQRFWRLRAKKQVPILRAWRLVPKERPSANKTNLDGIYLDMVTHALKMPSVFGETDPPRPFYLV